MPDSAIEFGKAVIAAVDTAVANERRRCLRLAREVWETYSDSYGVPVGDLRRLLNDIECGKPPSTE